MRYLALICFCTRISSKYAGDKIVRERIHHKAMQDIYTKRKDERSRKSKRYVEREFVEVLIFPSKCSSNNAYCRDRYTNSNIL